MVQGSALPASIVRFLLLRILWPATISLITLEHDFKREMNIQLVIHMDPIETDDAFTNEHRVMTEEIVRTFSDQITVHDFRVVRGRRTLI